MVSTPGAAEPAPLVSPNDAELIARIAQGDGAAFGVLAERLSPLLKRVLLRLGLEPAEVEDVGQETLVKLWHGSSSFRGRSSVSTWACRIAINQGITLLRNPRRRTADLPLELAVEGPEGEIARRELAAEVRAAVLALSPALRAVVILREFEGFSYREMAEALEIPIGTVMSRLNEARGRLRRSLRLAVESSE